MKVYFSENTFYFARGIDFERWTLYNKESAKLLRKIGVDFIWDSRLDWIRLGFKRCTGLREVNMGIDEVQLVKTFLRTRDGFQPVDMRPQDITPQLNLLALRANHMDKLRRLRVPKITFTPYIHGSQGSTSNQISIASRTTGPIPGGVLETVVAKEIMQAPEVGTPVKKTTTIPKLERKSGSEAGISPPIQPFRILDLPAEMRNRIYRYILVLQGPINPSKRIPTTHYRAGTNLSSSVLYRRGPAPCSSLALLQTNKQTYSEAVGIYYGHNSFVFYFPNQLMMFLISISEERKKYIERVTLWYKHQSQGDIDNIDVYLVALMNLKNLKQLELVIDDVIVGRMTGSHGPDVRLPGESLMKEIARSGIELVVRNQAVDVFFWRLDRDPSVGPRAVEMRGARKVILDLRERIRKSIEDEDDYDDDDDDVESDEGWY
ncbi:hypothetical protein K505DRAFT_305038 [Melanomma pulvis-pyrius CBS 109.77]|uniref:Uncharacterized protein n=1 Tax=Melanomma pulvis-pyrius CBS 109.77 TaxID=1314802 RepID=A0A6A6XD96_9PLEO|nr:hypothetical protein K505DRAFT_305038 [Melanomma pulvis-pyrius CBS 109.77]